MALVYDESTRGAPVNLRISEMDGTKQYLKHFENKLYLTFIASSGTQGEKWQAEKELVICERKMKFWEKHPNFTKERAQAGMEKAIKSWRG